MKTREIGGSGSELKFNVGEHKYYIDSKEIPSVTQVTNTIAKPALKYWAANQAGEYIENELEPGKKYVFDELDIKELAEGASNAHQKTGGEATSIGSLVHQFAEDFLQAKINNTKTPELPHNEKAKNGAKAFLNWYTENNIEPLQTEQILYHSNHNYAGTYDLLARVNGELTVIDYKTSKSIYDEYWLQVAAYLFASRHLRKLEGKDLPTQAGIIQFSKTSEDFDVETKGKKELWKHFWHGFLSARGTLYWQEEIV